MSSSNSRIETPGGRRYRFAEGLGMHEQHKYYCANRHKESRYALTKVNHFKIIRVIHRMFTEALLRGETVHLPWYMGSLLLVRRENKKFFQDGKLRVTSGVDWKATHQLWDEDEECRMKKTVVRWNDKYRYLIKWNKGKFPNAKSIEFRPSRALRADIFTPAQNNLDVPVITNRTWKRQ